MGNFPSLEWSKPKGGLKETQVENPRSYHEGNVEIFTDEDGTVVKKVYHAEGKTVYFEGPGPFPYRKGDLPSIVKKNGDLSWTDQRGRLHREVGPAKTYECFTEKKMVYSHEMDAKVMFTHFYDCKTQWFSHGHKVTKEWIEENKDHLGS